MEKVSQTLEEKRCLIKEGFFITRFCENLSGSTYLELEKNQVPYNEFGKMFEKALKITVL
ncbi:hypothetical protein COD90_06155 [Bacillus cereus]|nr:hypothetical protein COD90_06155 [Bacillus cereus]RFB10722.1 hypothetical protein DZB88_21670 [Bacillus sp. OE]